MKLTILQWNVWYKEDIRNIAKFLHDHPADIVCLQELTIQDTPEIGHTPDYIAKELGYHHHYTEIDEGEGKINIANGIFSRFLITDTQSTWTNEPRGGGGYDDEYRAYVEATLDVDGKQLRVGTTHMSYTHRFEPTERKHEETDKLLAQLRMSDTPLIFTGDLNALPGSYTIDSISMLLHHVGPDFERKSWTTKPFSYNGFEETELNWRLDYIFTTPDIRPVTAEILHTEYSDHLPVFAEVEL